jgi:hypothetical protein
MNVINVRPCVRSNRRRRFPTRRYLTKAQTPARRAVRDRFAEAIVRQDFSDYRMDDPTTMNALVDVMVSSIIEMRLKPRDAFAQLHSCMYIHFLTLRELNPYADDTATAFRILGGWGLISRALQAFPDDQALQQLCMHAMAGISAGAEARLPEVATVAEMEDMAAHVSTNLWRFHPQRLLQSSATVLAYHLAHDPATRRRLWAKEVPV